MNQASPSNPIRYFSAVDSTRVEIYETRKGLDVRSVFLRFGTFDLELTSFRGGKIEVYSMSEGLATFRGYLNEYAPVLGCVLRRLLSEAWLRGQPSQAARRALELSNGSVA